MKQFVGMLIEKEERGKYVDEIGKFRRLYVIHLDETKKQWINVSNSLHGLRMFRGSSQRSR